jgi:hypothetical protein
MTQQHRFTSPARRAGPLGAVVILACALALAAFARRQPVVQAERIELVTADGVRRAVLTADSSGFRVIVLDGRGRPVSALRLGPEPWLSVESGNGREVAGLGAPKVHQLTE